MGFPKSFGRPRGLAPIGFGQDDTELFSAAARNEVRSAKRLAASRSQFAQHGIAGGMAEPVIDAFEVVDIEENE